MKRLLTISVILVSAVVSAFAQKVDYTKYQVLAKSGDVSVVVRDSDYRMVVGSLTQPKKVFLLGYSKEQAAHRFEHLLEVADNDNYTRINRQICFCGVGLLLTIKGNGDDERYTFVEEVKFIKFNLYKRELPHFESSLKKSTTE